MDWSAEMSHRGRGNYVEYFPLKFLSATDNRINSDRFTSIFLRFTSGIFLFESFHPTSRIHNFLFTCHKGMALRTYFNSYVLLGGLCLNHISARTGDCRLRIFRVNTFFHRLLLSSSLCCCTLRLASFLSNGKNQSYLCKERIITN